MSHWQKGFVGVSKKNSNFNNSFKKANNTPLPIAVFDLQNW